MNAKIIIRYLIIFIPLLSFQADLRCQSLLWEISGNGLKDTSFLYGTMHIRDARIFDFGNTLWSRFEKAEAFAGEIILEGADKKAIARQLLLPKDTSLKMLIGKKYYRVVKKLAKPQLGPLAMLINRIKPIYLSGLITDSPSKDAKSEPIDMYFQRQAKKANKELIGLEEIKDQLKVINMFPLPQQAELLKASLNNMDSTRMEMEEMVKLYLSQDLDGLQNSVLESGMTAELQNAMLGGRNVAMAERISTLIHKQSIFIAVGAAHLGGKGGIIDLLKSQGYILTPIKFSFNNTVNTNE